MSISESVPRAATLGTAKADRRIVIIGAGTMGVGIAAVAARGPYKISVVEPRQQRRNEFMLLLESTMATDPSRGDIRAIEVCAALPEVNWSGAVLAIESVYEELSVKREVFAALEKVAPRTCVLASNSSSFPISDIASGLKTADRMLNLHFFMPAHLVPGVEVVQSAATDPTYAAITSTIMRQCSMVPVTVKKDLPGFLANRLQHALSREAYSLIDAGIASPEDIDRAVRFCFGFRYLAAGPALQRDHSGIEIHAAAAASMYPSLDISPNPARCLTDKVQAGNLGIKTGKGFYDWSAEESAAERERYTAVLQGALSLLAEEIATERGNAGTF